MGPAAAPWPKPQPPTALKTPLLALALLSFSFSSCDRDQPTPKYTRAWLSQTEGQQLVFRNSATGAADTLQTVLSDETHSLAGKFDFRSHDYQVISLRYALSRYPNTELVELQFNGDGRVELGLTMANQFERYAHIETHPQASQEHLYGSDRAELQKLDNLLLNGRQYARVAHLSYTRGGLNGIREYWYSKQDGLVAYTRHDGQTLYRVW